MAGAGDRIIIYNAGAYNSDDHFQIIVTVTEDGYDIASEADSLYDSSVKGANGHVPVGFFCNSSAKTVANLKKMGIIPALFSSARIDLIPDAMDELMLYDQKARYHRRSASQPERARQTGEKQGEIRRNGQYPEPDITPKYLRVRVIPKETRICQLEEDRFSGEFLLRPKAGKTFDAVDNRELVSCWHRTCPFHTAGERWAFFLDHLNCLHFPHFPKIVVQRDSAERYRIVFQDRDYMMVDGPIEVLKLNDEPVPIQGASRGFWHADLPCKGPWNHRAYLYVEYYDDWMRWVYKSTISVEVGRMGRYEDDDYSKTEEHHETEFASRGILIQQLMEFIPRYSGMWSSKGEAGEHAISISDLPDDLLSDLLDPFFL